MPKFLSRLFSGSSFRSSSFRGSQTSLSDTHSPSKTSSNIRTTSSLENLASYHVTPKELEKNKLHKAAWEGNLKKVQHLARPGQINLKDSQKRTPLHLAVVKGHIDIVRYLVEEGAKLDVVDNEQRTPLIKAILSGVQNIKRNYQICEILVNGGADKSINSVDKHGRTALHYAIDFGNEHLVGLFLSNENCDPNFKDHDQMTPLHLAIKRNSSAIVRLLLSDQHDQQADPNIVNRFGQTPLHLAASVGYVDIIRIILLSNLNEPCDPTILDSQQLTAYELAKNNHHEICAKLIEEYQEKWLKTTPKRLLSTSFNEQSSIKATSSISMHPKANLQRNNDATSEDSSSMSTNKPSKPSPKRIPRASDQWSDDTGLSGSDNKPVLHGLIKNNPLEPHVTQTNTANSTLSSLVQNNPIQKNSKRPAPTAQRTQSSTIFGIQPAFDRKDSDNTSTSISTEKLTKPVQQILEKKPVNILPKQVSNTRSWSDDTITTPIEQIKKSERHSETWDSSTSDDDNLAISKPQHVSNILQKTLPFSLSKDDLNESDSDNNSVDTEIRNFNITKPSNEPTIQKLVNTKIGDGYKVIGPTKIQSPVSEDSSWTTTSAKINKEPIIQTTTTNTKGIVNLVQQMKTDESTWDDSQTLSHNLKQSKDLSQIQTKGVENLIKQIKTDESTWDDSHLLSHSLKQSKDSSKIQTKGIENLVKIMDTIVQTKSSNRPTSSNIIGKLITTSMFERPDSRESQSTLHEIDNDEDYEQSWKKKTEQVPGSSMKDHASKKIPHSSLPYDTNNLRGSISSTKSSFSDLQINELKENIKKLERNQEDTQELKRQLKDMENKKNNFEKLYKENDQMLRHIENKLEQEKTEKQRLEWTTNNLNTELQNIKQKLQLLEDEKDLLNQRCNTLKEERDKHDEKLRILQANNLPTTIKSSYHDDDNIDKIQSRHREELKLLSAENDDLHNRTKQLESDLDLHKESLDVTVHYKIKLEKALEEKTFYQHELDRLKHEKNLIEQEKFEYKTKYNSLQDEIRLILLDRSKLEQNLTSELHEHIQEKHRTTNDQQKYRIEIEQLNMKLNDAETRLHLLQTQNETLLISKDQDIKNEYETLSQRLQQIESNKLNAEQHYHNQHNEITNKQQILNQPSLTHTSNNQDKHSHSLSSCQNCNTFQRYYEQEREYRLQTEKDNERLRDTVSYQKQYQYLNKPFLLQQQNNENYLVENSKKIRNDTDRVKSELNRLRQDFDKLISNYDPINNFQQQQQQTQLNSQIDIFRQFYENDFRQRQLLMSKLIPTLKSSLTQNYHKLSSPNLNHNHSFNETSTTYTNNRLLSERLDKAIHTSLADQRLLNIKQIPALPRQASSLLTINTINNNNNNNSLISPYEFLRERYHV
ncbi:unnamed protein product [Rotaria sordida]|uniref:Uncharacterized protein n=1 Tax=Rotaria sordida TaxID=392033 RepID=A0A814RHA7_9BILA|nr:unnamed protein product [Rotaria sordida]CAF3895805.1 unnamed protein product [Rotaria sordida]